MLLTRPGRRRLGLVCLVASLVSLTLQVGRSQDSLIIRHVQLPQGVAVWMSIAGTHVLIGDSERVRGAMLDMLHDQGVARADLLIGLDSLAPDTRLCGPLQVISQPSSLVILYGRMRWSWRCQGTVRLEGGRVQTPRSLWELDRDGPLELETDGVRLWERDWSDQATSSLTSNTRSQGSSTWSDSSGNPVAISLASRTSNSLRTAAATSTPASLRASVPRWGRTAAW